MHINVLVLIPGMDTALHQSLVQAGHFFYRDYRSGIGVLGLNGAGSGDVQVYTLPADVPADAAFALQLFERSDGGGARVIAGPAGERLPGLPVPRDDFQSGEAVFQFTLDELPDRSICVVGAEGRVDERHGRSIQLDCCRVYFDPALRALILNRSESVRLSRTHVDEPAESLLARHETARLERRLLLVRWDRPFPSFLDAVNAAEDKAAHWGDKGIYYADLPGRSTAEGPVILSRYASVPPDAIHADIEMPAQ